MLIGISTSVQLRAISAAITIGEVPGGMQGLLTAAGLPDPPAAVTHWPSVATVLPDGSISWVGLNRTRQPDGQVVGLAWSPPSQAQATPVASSLAWK